MIEIEIERTKNYPLLMRIATHPRIYRPTSDDASPLPEAVGIPEREDCIYLLARIDQQILGFVAFSPVNGATFEVHVCFLSRGPVNQQAFAKMLGWMWGATKAQRIIGAVPSYNRLAIAFAEKAGFNVYGVNPKSWMKHGKLHSMICLGISRPNL
jgi:RimJ/RimL family protein N-acetyltransferase